MKLKQKLMATILTVIMLTGYVATLTDAVIAAGVNLSRTKCQNKSCKCRI